MNRREIDFTEACRLMPTRSNDSNKGSFGRVLALIGSEKYRGAAHLVTESMLRAGAGYTEIVAPNSVCDSLIQKFPEAIYIAISDVADASEYRLFSERAESASAILIGPGCGASIGLGRQIISLIASEGAPLVIDADGINSMALCRDAALSALKNSARTVILTPHPLELSRLLGCSVESINFDRQQAALGFVADYKAILLLKGYRTVIASEKNLFINTSGSSALAKAGSGDTLAGLLASLLATRLAPCDILTALAAYIHGKAGDELSDVFSDYGVIPSDLPRRMAMVMKTILDSKPQYM